MRPLSNWDLHAAVIGGVGAQLAAALAPFVSNLASRLVWRQMGHSEKA